LFAKDNIYVKEIEQLTTDSLKKEYLESIFRADQEIRAYWSESSQKDTSSQARKRVLNEVREVDSINLIKVRLYLEKYGHPKREHIDGLALATPWCIVHHATHNEARIELYPILLKAYRDGDLEEEPFRLYLCRTLSEYTGLKYDSFYGVSVEELVGKMDKVCEGDRR
jgi:hypothetical protein